MRPRDWMKIAAGMSGGLIVFLICILYFNIVYWKALMIQAIAHLLTGELFEIYMDKKEKGGS